MIERVLGTKEAKGFLFAAVSVVSGRRILSLGRRRLRHFPGKDLSERQRTAGFGIGERMEEGGRERGPLRRGRERERERGQVDYWRGTNFEREGSERRVSVLKVLK